MVDVDFDALLCLVVLFVVFVKIGDLAVLTGTDNEELLEKIAFFTDLSTDFSQRHKIRNMFLPISIIDFAIIIADF